MQLRSGKIVTIQNNSTPETLCQEFTKHINTMLNIKKGMTKRPYIEKVKYVTKIYQYLDDNYHIWSLPNFHSFHITIHHKSKELLCAFNMKLIDIINIKEYYDDVIDYHHFITHVTNRANSLIEKSGSFKMYGYSK